MLLNIISLAMILDNLQCGVCDRGVCSYSQPNPGALYVEDVVFVSLHNYRCCCLCAQVALSSSVAHENMVQLLDVFAEGTELVIVVRCAPNTQHGGFVLCLRLSQHDSMLALNASCVWRTMRTYQSYD